MDGDKETRCKRKERMEGMKGAGSDVRKTGKVHVSRR